MAKLPPIRVGQHKVCIICEGNEDYAYMQRMLELNVWNSAYDFQLINAKSESNIFARYQDAYNNDRYEIILLHFGDVSLKNQGKKTNVLVIEQLTGVPDYDAHADQIEAIRSKIFRRSYADMRRRAAEINLPGTEPGSTNFIVYLDRFEQEDIKWIREINDALEK